MRRRVLPVLLLLLAGLVVYACGGDSVAPTESVMPGSSARVAATSDGSGGEPTGDVPLERGRPDNKVDICHIPPGNPDNARVINVSVNAVTAHRGHGDPENFVENPNGSCGPADVVGCDCFTRADFADFIGDGADEFGFLLCDAAGVNWHPANLELGQVEVNAGGEGFSAGCAVRLNDLNTFIEISDAQFDVCSALVIDIAAAAVPPELCNDF